MGGSGGSSSSAISYPAHMTSQHTAWLSAINTEISTIANPFTDVTSYDPETHLDAIDTEIDNYTTDIDELDSNTSWVDAVRDAWDQLEEISNDEVTAADIDAYGDILDEELANRAVPRFQNGMLTVNAVLSSAFVIGNAMIESAKVRDVAKYAAEIKRSDHSARIQGSISGADTILRTTMMKFELRKAIAQIVADTNRIRIVSEKEQADHQILLDEHEAVWGLAKYQYGANMMGSIAGSAISTGSHKPTTLQTGLSGALSGASAGMMMSGGNPAMGLLGGVGGLLAGIV